MVQGALDFKSDEEVEADLAQVAALMLAETVSCVSILVLTLKLKASSIGILSIPSAFATVGMPAGILLVIGLGAIATYTGWVIGAFASPPSSALRKAAQACSKCAIPLR